jgi:hypothetical protein
MDTGVTEGRKVAKNAHKSGILTVLEYAFTTQRFTFLRILKTQYGLVNLWWSICATLSASQVLSSVPRLPHPARYDLNPQHETSSSQRAVT